MEHRRKTHWIWLSAIAVSTLLGLSSTARAGSCGGSASYQSAVQVAQAGFRDFASRALTAYAKKMHGLAAEDSYQNAALGRPYRLYQILPDKVAACVNQQTCSSPEAISAPFAAEVYMFPVLFSGKLKLMMTVFTNPKSGQPEIGSLGDKWLAGQLAAILRQWPDGKYPLMLYKSGEAQTYGFSIPSYSTHNFTLIDPANKGAADYVKLSGLADAVSVLSARIARAQGGVPK